jgi:putative membrane protein
MEHAMKHSQFRITTLAAALIAIGFAGGAVAQSYGSSSTSGSTATADHSAKTSLAEHGGKLAHSDKSFIEEAAKGGMAEVELGNLASQKATNPQVKAFGERMAKDHAKANEELASLANSKGVQLPAKEKLMERHETNKLAKEEGAKFDREYIDHAVKDHQKDVKEFEKQAQNAKDPDLRAWAQKTLPTLQDHLRMAQAAQASVHGAAGTSPTASRYSSPSSASSSTASVENSTPSTAATNSANVAGAAGANTGGTGGSTPRSANTTK